MEPYGALNGVDPRSTADAHENEFLDNTTEHDGKTYDVGRLWAEENIQLPNNYFSALIKKN